MTAPMAFPVALVTGGSRGIGRGIGLELARLKMGVAINYARDEAAARLAQKDLLLLGAPWVEIFRADISNADDRHRLIQEIRARAGRLDVLVNNAGIASPRRGDLLELTEDQWDHVLDVNLKGPFFLTQLVARWLIEQRQAGIIPRGMIINITSISAATPSLQRGEYCVSKAGAAMGTQLWAHRLAEHGIQVFEIRPGIIRTDMTAAVTALYDAKLADGLTPIRRWGEPQDVGKAVAALVGGAFPFSTGEVLHVDGGFHSRVL